MIFVINGLRDEQHKRLYKVIKNRTVTNVIKTLVTLVTFLSLFESNVARSHLGFFAFFTTKRQLSLFKGLGLQVDWAIGDMYCTYALIYVYCLSKGCGKFLNFSNASHL
jgi:hypothetical protein